jgi:hypothetical protein
MFQPAKGMYFAAIRDRDNKKFVGMIKSVKSMGDKGMMVTIKMGDGKYANIYLKECFDYAWSDFALPPLVWDRARRRNDFSTR